jgi:acylphosphatase
MVFNPTAFATPQQIEQLARMQKFTEKIKYIVHTDDGRVEVSLQTDDPEAAKLIPQIQEGIVSSVTQMLYMMFAMTGERV